jgi:hypothetical protein
MEKKIEDGDEVVVGPASFLPRKMDTRRAQEAEDGRVLIVFLPVFSPHLHSIHDIGLSLGSLLSAVMGLQRDLEVGGSGFALK